jgi:hypothetical protein
MTNGVSELFLDSATLRLIIKISIRPNDSPNRVRARQRRSFACVRAAPEP